MKARILTFALIFVPIFLAAGPWERLTDGEAAQLGWSRGELEAAQDYSRTIQTEAVMLVAGGKVLEAWGAVDRKLNVHSIRKSFLSALFGIQAQAGTIRLDATMAELEIGDHEPGLSEVEKRATVRDLLKARSGIYHPALYETAGMKKRRPARYSHEPGTFWYYNNWDFNALGTIYEQECGAGIYEDFQRLIAGPLGMEDFALSDGEYFTGADSVHRAYPFRLTARDLARFGLLFLREGRWDGSQIVPAEWVRDCIGSHSDAGASGGYGYLWWVARGTVHLPGVALPEGSYSARGAGGHYILNIPALDLVIVHRVNTDIDGQRVEPAQFGELVRLILGAHEPRGETLLPLLMCKHRVPGAAVLAIEKGRIRSERYLGVAEAGTGRAVTADTVFEVASMTKPLAAHAAMQMVEQGQLDLDRPLRSYLAEPYLADDPLHEEITARMVLNHTGGLPNWRPKGGALQVMHKPGSAYLYSGEGIVYLQRVIEHVTGLDYEAFMRRALLDPLGMERSSHVWSDAVAAQAAAGHDANGTVKPDRRHYTRPNAAYSLYTTARDYAVFVLEMMKPALLKKESLAAMFTPSSPPTGRPLLSRRGSTGAGDIRFGIGWSVEPTASGPRIRHSGANGTGFRSYVEFDPAAGHGLVILTNSDSGDGFWQEVVEALGVP